jgi:predicted GNAT family N-acyltransferase
MELKEHGTHGNDSGPLTIINSKNQIFEPGIIGRSGELTFVRNPTLEGFSDIYEMASREIGPDIASFEVMRDVMNHNPLSFWGIYRSASPERSAPRLAGFFAFLLLNARGLEAHRHGRLNRHQPELYHLANNRERPAAVYIWAVVAHRLSNIGSQLIAHAMGTDWFFDVPVFGTIGTSSGQNAVRNSATLHTDDDHACVGETFEYRPTPEIIRQTLALPIVEGTRPEPKPAEPWTRFDTRVVSRQEDLAKVFAIRAAVFMAEQSCPYSEEFDENDFVGMHILGTVSGEAAATLRVRFFADFAKLERWAVLPMFRGTMIGRHVVEHALNVCQRKGYRRIYAHAQLRFVEKWKRFGLRPMLKNAPLVFSDHEYIEMEGELPSVENSLTLQSDPYMLIRPEGRWDMPGVLEKSASRGAAGPF